MIYEEVIEIKSAKERFMGNYKLFSKFLFQFPERSLFGELKKQIEDGDVHAAFETAHTMKGITGNLSLKLISAPLSFVVEALRGGKLPDPEHWQALQDAYERTVAAIQTLQEEGTVLF